METPNEMRMKVVGKATEDADFRARLLSDPKGAIGQELGVTIPASLSVEVHEESGATAASGASARQQAERRQPAGGRRRLWLHRSRSPGAQLVIPPGRSAVLRARIMAAASAESEVRVNEGRRICYVENTGKGDAHRPKDREEAG